MKGGGIFCDGATSTIEGCFVLNNASNKGTNSKQNQIFAGGMFMYEGTCFNSLFANNYSYGSAGGVGFCVGRFFNNTIAYNTATLVETNISGGAISLATSSNPNLFVANTVVFGNTGIAIRDRNAGVDKVNPFLYCYIQSTVAQPYATTKNNVNNWSESATSQYVIGNTFLNGVAPSAANTPFVADFDENGDYVAGRAASLNDFRLRDDVPCVNKGTEEFAGEFYNALIHKGKTDSQIRNLFVYKTVEASELPANDVAFAKRVQDCQIDIGAYEFNAAYAIRPDTTTHPGRAIYYVTFDSPGGDASSTSPENAACRQKLQLVLDAAGRYKYSLMTAAYFNRGDSVVDETVVGPKHFIANQPNKHWTVEVWLEGDSVNSRKNDEYAASYTPTRSTKHSIDFYHDNTLDYSFIVPHGIYVKGGYKRNFFHYDADKLIDDRDPLTFRTVLSGNVVSSTGAQGQTFHVVTFTNDLFSVEDEKYYRDGENQPIRDQLAAFSALPDADRHRAVLDGLFIMDGYANSPDKEDRIGAGCVVTDFAHIRNCVVQNNVAGDYGGGLYLKPMALVSGTIVKNNTAETGGGIYIEPHPRHHVDSLAHVFATTICQNTATMSAGGMWFDNTDARVNSTALWHNTANDNANVSGIFSRSSANTDYPFNYCAVESRRLEGQGNVELSPSETEGVRWDRQDPFDKILYYPIEMSSTLSRAGMTYRDWQSFRNTYPTLDTMDIAGVSRMSWLPKGRAAARGYAWDTDTLVHKSNDFIEIGARAINKDYRIKVDSKYIMRRLYVMHTDLINSEAARALQDNTLDNDTANMYRQMGSCTLNPFHRLGDALDYVIAARKADTVAPRMGLRNARFEIYVEQGTYYPYHNAYGEQGQVRNNTFLIPEATTIVGGLNSSLPNHNYCQEGYADRYTNTLIGNGSDITIRIAGGGSYTLNYAPAEVIRICDGEHRPMRDYNLNSVIEPWEFERQTILSGNAVAGEDFTHIYHVITAHADSLVVGPQPIRYRTDNYETNYPHWREGKQYPLLTNPIAPDDDDHFGEECDLSVAARSIILDGLQITGGYANHLDEADVGDHQYQTKTYFRGGGIFIDGNWKESFDDADPSGIPNVTMPAQYNIPLVVRNSQFTGNMAGNGGGIYSNGDIHVYSCHFTQNYSQGPMTKLDQQYIPWTAGGCIATNAFCGVVNTLFDNNEARRGLYPINVASESERIPDADARQGFGGVLSVATDSKMRVANCHFMKNKAVAYSAIYNFLANNHYTDPNARQFAFNSIFWGNEVFDVEDISDLDYVEAPSEDQIIAFNTKYKASRSGVFHYDGDMWARYEQLFHQYDSIYTYWTAPERGVDQNPFHADAIAKLQELRLVADSLEGLYFCSYRKTYGPTGMKPTDEGYLMTSDEYDAYKDSRQMPVKTKLDDNNDRVEDYSKLFTYLHGNNNVLINRINNATDGPNFKQPSFVAGIDGYMQNADWLLARMNLTTDQGWGFMKQRVARGIAYYITRYTGQTKFETAEAALAAAKLAKSDTCTMWSVLPVSGLPEATFDGVEQPAHPALYNFLAKNASRVTLTTPRIPVGTQDYMEYTSGATDAETTGEMYRISMRPRIGDTAVYIDLGIYEYQYVQLDIKGNEIDTMWVATKTRGLKHDGLSWESPTTDLQAAIDMLMSSHNNHDKYICLLGDDEQSFSPANVIDNRRAFIITSNTLSPLMPDSAEADHDYGVKSLNFLGGYSFSVKDAPRDPAANPTVFEMPNAGNTKQLNQLVIVEDMTRQMVQVNWLGEYTSRDSVVIPVSFDGITFINPFGKKEPSAEGYSALGGSMSGKGGAAIYYRWQRKYEESNGTSSPNMNLALYPDSTLIDDRKVELPKLTISNCVFKDCGERTANPAERTPALRIGYGGGSSLIVNSLFHSNAGAPIYGRRTDVVSGENNFAQVHNPVVIVNSTFALNGGHIRLGCDGSQVHNSLIWMDDLTNDTTTQLQIGEGSGEHIFDRQTRQNNIGYPYVTNNAVWGCFRAGDETYHNDSLSSENSDIFNGPNFIAPDIAATTSEAYRARDFRLNPGVRTMNMADTTLYRNLVFFRRYPDDTPEADNEYWRRPMGFKSTLITALANDSDLAAKPRLHGIGMERGAYECRAVLQRVLYVEPNTVTAGDGSSWESPFGQGQLQNAIDAAAVYTYLSQGSDRETKRAFVFVKASDAANEHIIARDGVSVYGSLPGGFSDTAYLSPDTMAFTNGECHRYVNYVRSVVPGVASPDATPSRIKSLTVSGDDYEIGFLLDGFVISNQDEELNTSPVVLNNSYATVRNCIIRDNTVKGGLPVVDVQNGLLYNSLVCNDSAASLVRVGANGLLLNNTIVADKENCTPVDATSAALNAMQNNLSCELSAARCFAPYLTSGNPYSLPAYLTANPVLGYQLHERSREINGGNNVLPALFDPYVADSIICFWRDRDILGNPRKIGGTVDKGALETWRVEPKTVVELTSLTDEASEAQITNSVYAETSKAYKKNYGGHAYPHPGSVVYLMDSSAMTMSYAELDFRDIILRPGYMLLKRGASFYGNGQTVQMNYLAAEKPFHEQRYSMTAFPFRYLAGDVCVTTYNRTTDALSLSLSPFTFATYQYNGVARSAKDYVFRTENSSLWIPIDTLNRTATEGYLMDFGEEIDTVLRFTGYADELGQYVYQENGDMDKLVELIRYDNRTAGSGASLNFTRLEDMGWNMKGLPWLVSNYRTDTILAEGNYQRQMHIPHVFYQMDGAGEYIKGDRIYTSRSWDRGSTLSMGNAFFVQTATRSDAEDVFFHLPLYTFNEKASRPIIRLVAARPVSGPMDTPARETSTLKQQLSSDYLTIIPDSTADKRVQYAYGRDGVKWHTADDIASVYLLDHRYSSQLSLLGAAPTEVDIPLGVSIPATENREPSTDYTFQLPEPEAFEGYGYVWLIDRQRNRVVNLLEEDYTAVLEAGVNNTRFAVRIGGFPLTDEKGNRQYIVYAFDGTLYVRGLIPGDKLAVYTPSGQMLCKTVSAGTEFTMPLYMKSGYVVRVNDTAHKVVNY